MSRAPCKHHENRRAAGSTHNVSDVSLAAIATAVACIMPHHSHSRLGRGQSWDCWRGRVHVTNAVLARIATAGAVAVRTFSGLTCGSRLRLSRLGGRSELMVDAPAAAVRPLAGVAPTADTLAALELAASSSATCWGALRLNQPSPTGPAPRRRGGAATLATGAAAGSSTSKSLHTGSGVCSERCRTTHAAHYARTSRGRTRRRRSCAARRTPPWPCPGRGVRGEASPSLWRPWRQPSRLPWRWPPPPSCAQSRAS
jgi:hypothetical protein